MASDFPMEESISRAESSESRDLQRHGLYISQVPEIRVDSHANDQVESREIPLLRCAAIGKSDVGR
jgi:hypothetical protein